MAHLAYLDATVETAAAGQSPWPPEALQSFVLRMAAHGHSISRTLMTFDRRYALEQLNHAHSLADGELRELAMALFRHFERQRSGLPYRG
jgi:hypothetical protein